LQVKDVLARLDGVGDVRVFGARDYAMRIWLDPDKIAARSLTAGEVVSALQSQNIQVASGVLNQPPTTGSGAFQLNVETLGRLTDPRQFGNVIVKNDPNGRVTAHPRRGARRTRRAGLQPNGYLDERVAVTAVDFPAAGIERAGDAELLIAKMQELSRSFPEGCANESSTTRRNSSPKAFAR